MANSEQYISGQEEDEFEKFMQESLSTDVTSSAESTGLKEDYKLWWMDSKNDKKESKTANCSTIASWLKKQSKDSDVANVSEHSAALPVELKKGSPAQKQTSANKHGVATDQKEEVSSAERLESDKESHYSETFESSSSEKPQESVSDDKRDSFSDEQATLEQESTSVEVDDDDDIESEGRNVLFASDLSLNFFKTEAPNLQADDVDVEDNKNKDSGTEENFSSNHLNKQSSNTLIQTFEPMQKSEEMLNVGDKNGNIYIKNNENEADLKSNAEDRKVSDHELLLKVTEYEKLLEQKKLEEGKLKEEISLKSGTEKELTTRIVEFENKLELSQLECKTLKAGLKELERESLKKQQELQQKYEEKSSVLQKENILLRAKIGELELKGKSSPSDTVSPEDMRVLKDQVIQLQKEIQDQEDLLQGFQKENERLYAELKNVQKTWKVTENKLKTQNQQLGAEVTRLKEQSQVMNKAKNFKLEFGDANKTVSEVDGISGKPSSVSGLKMSLTDELSQRYQDEIKQLLELTKNQNEEKLAYELVHIQDIKTIEELAKQLKTVEDKLAQNINNIKSHLEDSPKKKLENDIDMAKMKKLQSEITKFQEELKIKEQEKEDISKFYEEEYEKIKFDAEKKGTDLRTVQLELQPLKVKIEELRLELEASEERNKQLISQLQRKRQIPRMSKAIQTITSPEKKRSDVVLENKELKIMLEKMETQKRELETNIQIIKDETERIVEIEQHECELQIEQLKKKHANELQKVISEMAAQHSTSKVAELKNKLQSQEILYGQIKEQTIENEELKSKIDLLQVVNSDLETEIKELRIDLSKTKSMQSPQMRDILALQDEIRELEKRQHRREEELHYLMHQLKRNDTTVLKQEIIHWKQQVIEKNRELEYFRSELNTILLFLGELERQGITIPTLKSREKAGDDPSMGRPMPS